MRLKQDNAYKYLGHTIKFEGISVTILFSLAFMEWCDFFFALLYVFVCPFYSKACPYSLINSYLRGQVSLLQVKDFPFLHGKCNEQL
jgi:hypothetical protein